MKFDVAIVGAGSAGAVLAARLSERGDRSVLLLEAGPDHDVAHAPAALRDASFLHAVAEPGRTWPNLVARRTLEQGDRRYVRGRGVGGSSAVNAMLALPGEPDDYDEWEQKYGCAGWGWAAIAPWAARVTTTWSRADASMGGPLTQALMRVEPTTEWALLTRDAAGRRVSTNESHLERARARPNLTVRGDALVDRVLLDGHRAVGVLLVDGTVIEADQVIVSAGAIHSPAILLRSGVDRPGLGEGLQDHPSVPLSLRLRDDVPRTTGPAVSSVLRTTFAEHHDLQLLAFDAIDAAQPSAALLMGAVMRVHSRGRVRLASSDATIDPVVDFAMLSDERDLNALRAVAQMAERVALSAPIRAVAELLPYDISDDSLRRTVGDYVHAVGTCRMGDPDDPMAVVDPRCAVIGHEGLMVCDASVMPAVPRANTHMPVVMIAERVAALLAEA